MGASSDRVREAESEESSRFRPHTQAVLDRREAAQRKRLGQYFTPRGVRRRLLDQLELVPGMRVLDPGAGTGEFLLDVRERCPEAVIEGFDVDAELVAACRDAGLDGVIERDFLRARLAPSYDLVIGNPPYYEVRGDPDLVAGYRAVTSGRPNVFSMFFQAALGVLKPGGRLAFVVPPSMNNGRYFAALREHILSQASIEFLCVLPGSGLFDGAQQAVMLIVLRKGGRGERFVFRAGFGRSSPEALFMERPERLAELLEGRHTLASLGYEIRTGRCVWNQHKEKLRRVAEEGAVPLIWSHNIRDGELVLDDDASKPQYVCFDSPDLGPAIVVNRITGTVGGGGLRAACIPTDLRFVAENHVNVAQRPPSMFGDRSGTPDDRAVVAALRSEQAIDALRLITGNTQLSSRELRYLIPLMERPDGVPAT